MSLIHLGQVFSSYLFKKVHVKVIELRKAWASIFLSYESKNNDNNIFNYKKKFGCMHFDQHTQID